jgi:hypothetical protein
MSSRKNIKESKKRQANIPEVQKRNKGREEDRTRKTATYAGESEGKEQ